MNDNIGVNSMSEYMTQSNNNMKWVLQFTPSNS
jgi:hypothetical protein